MYEIEIRNADNEKEAGYSFTDQNIYTRDIVIENNMITFNRVVKEDSGYNAASQEYVTNNLERGESAVQLESYSTELQGVQCRANTHETRSGCVERAADDHAGRKRKRAEILCVRHGRTGWYL